MGGQSSISVVDQSGVIVAQALTYARVDDASTAVDLILVVNGEIASVTAAAAYDTIAVYAAAGARGAQVVVPPKRTAAVSRRRPRSLARNRSVKHVQEIGRRRWKTETGDHRLARVESVFCRSSERAFARGVQRGRGLRRSSRVTC